MDKESLEQMLESLRGSVVRDVREGVAEPAEICQSALDENGADEENVETLRPHLERFLREAMDAHMIEQSTWKGETDCDRLNAVFADLEKNGIVARQNFACCNNCGNQEIWEEIEGTLDQGCEVRGYAFYHMQDTQSAAMGRGLYISYGAAELGPEALAVVGSDVAAMLLRHNLPVEWNGDVGSRILVRLDWKRRRTGTDFDDR